MRAFLGKLLSRLGFIGLAIVLVPLAALNRQSVNLDLNVLAWIYEQPSQGVELPLFVIIAVALAVGFIAGWWMSALLRWKNQLSQNRAARRQLSQSNAADHLPEEAIMLEERTAK